MIGALFDRLFPGVKADMSPHEPGTRFALYRSLIVGYMDRYVLRTPWFNLRLHHILREDQERHPHDHPFAFRSLILWGGYTEVRLRRRPSGVRRFAEFAAGDRLTPADFDPPERRRYRAGDVVSCGLEDVHRLVEVEPGTWTLVLSTGRKKGWGFLTPTGLIPWKRYFVTASVYDMIDDVMAFKQQHRQAAGECLRALEQDAKTRGEE